MRSERLVTALHDGELESPLRREVASHVSGCADCSHRLATLDRMQELLSQAFDEESEKVDFSNFWAGVASKLQEQTPPWTVRLRLWRASWQLHWPISAPVWAAAALLITTTLFLANPPSSNNEAVPAPQEVTTLALAANQQAHIESLSTASTISLWNEPASNATVIWVSEEDDGGMP
ncbi:MAG: anti-sigma factor family protein [Candidatus Binatia bacterium]